MKLAMNQKILTKRNKLNDRQLSYQLETRNTVTWTRNSRLRKKLRRQSPKQYSFQKIMWIEFTMSFNSTFLSVQPLVNLRLIIYNYLDSINFTKWYKYSIIENILKSCWRLRYNNVKSNFKWSYGQVRLSTLSSLNHFSCNNIQPCFLFYFFYFFTFYKNKHCNLIKRTKKSTQYAMKWW